MGYPLLQSLVNEINTELYNIPQSIDGYRTPKGFTTRDVLSPTFDFVRKLYDPKKKAPEGLLKRYEVFHVDFEGLDKIYEDYKNSLSAVLDSLEREGAIPPEFINYYRDKHIIGKYAKQGFTDSLMPGRNAGRTGVRRPNS